MSARVKSLLIALLLGMVASAIALTLLLVKKDDIPLFHRVTDLRSHYAALNARPNSASVPLGMTAATTKTARSSSYRSTK